MNCPKCETRLIEDANYCHICGAGVAPEPLSVARDPFDFDAREDGSAEASCGDRPSLPTDELSIRNAGPDGNHGQQTETTVWEGRFSPWTLAMSSALVAVATLFGGVVLVYAAVRDIRGLFVVLMMGIPALWVIQSCRLLKKYLIAYYRVTSRRILIEYGILERQKDQIDMAHVEEVRVRQNVLHRLLDVGSIEIHVGERRRRRVVLHGIREVDRIAEEIRTLAKTREVATKNQLAPV